MLTPFDPYVRAAVRIFCASTAQSVNKCSLCPEMYTDHEYPLGGGGGGDAPEAVCSSQKMSPTTIEKLV